MSRPRVLVTGAGGFIGGWVAEAMTLADDVEVRAGVSRWMSATRIARFRTEIVLCDVMKQSSLDAALVGVDVVVHCARAKGNDNSVTIDGTKLLIERARAAGVRKLIFLSSVAVYGEASGLVHEDTAPAALSVYGVGKRAAEETCRELSSPEMPIAAIRPTLVYGPFSDLWTMPYFFRFASGRWRALGPRGEGKCNLVYVGDVVRFIRFLIDRDLGPYAVFNANGPEVPTWNSYLERFNAALGHPPLRAPDQRLGLKVLLTRPIRLAGKYALARHKGLVIAASNRSTALRELMKKTEENLRLAPSAGEMQHFSGDVTFSMDAARAAGFVPPTSVDRGIALTVDWARNEGLVH